MKKKALKIAGIALTGLLCSAGTVFASAADLKADFSSYYEKEADAALHESDISPQMVCLECESILQMRQVCRQECNYAGTRTHKCGFLWQDTCTVDSYYSYMVYYCDFCGNIVEPILDEESEGHLCLEIHSKCGAGDNGHYNVCLFDKDW